MNELILLCSICLLTGVISYLIIYKPVAWVFGRLLGARYIDDRPITILPVTLTYTPGQRSIIIPVSKYPSDEERQRIIEYLEDVIAELDCMGDE